jgi:hypothetical protein
MKQKKANKTNWVQVAAKNILSDLGGRRGIRQALDECDDEVMQEITASIEAIINIANREATDDANSTFP